MDEDQRVGFRLGDALGGAFSMSARSIAFVGVLVVIAVGAILPFSLRGGKADPPSRACVADDLGAWSSQNAVTPSEVYPQVQALYDFTRCLVPSRFVVVLTDNANNELVRSSVLTQQEYDLAIVGRSRVVRVEGAWTNWCADAPAAPIRTRFEFKNGVVAVSSPRFDQIPPEVPPRCDDPSAPTQLSLGHGGISGEPVSSVTDACHADQLTVRPNSTFAPGVLAYRTEFVESSAAIANTSPVVCLAPVLVAVVLQDATGETIARDDDIDRDDQGVLASANFMRLTLKWSSWCGPPPQGPLRAVIELKRGGELVWAVERVTVLGSDVVTPPCHGRASVEVSAATVH